MAIINVGKLIVQGSVHELLNSGNNRVKVDARPVERAAALARSLQFVSGVKEEDRCLEITIPLEQTWALNAALVAGGVEVHSLVPQRSLEEYFLSITEGTTEITSRGSVSVV